VLRLRLLGELAVELDGAAVEPPSSRRAWALLGWLALHPGLHPRGSVASRFWPDVLDASARGSLRSAIWALRRALGRAGERYLYADHERVGLDPAAEVWVDVAAFDELVAAGRIEEAAALGSSGELLAGLDDDWVLEARDEHRAKLTDVFERLALDAQQRGDPPAAIGWTRRQTSLDPLAEQPLRRLMERLANGGDRGAALAAYERFRDRLERELRLAPSVETRRLAGELREGRPAGAGRPIPGYESALPLVGRDDDLARLLAAWRAARAGSGAVVTISGEPGIGKTRLALELLERARAEGAGTASCAALDLGGGAPLGLWAELIGDLSRDLDAPPLDAAWPTVLAPLVPDLEHRLGRQPGRRTGAAPALERARLFEATVALLEWASRRPLVLLLEDVHAADAASLELAGYVGRRAAGLPVLLVLTRRPLPRRADVDALEHALRARGRLACELTLRPLAPTEVARLARMVAPLPAARVEQVVAAADGNPLLAVECARALGRGEDERPETLRGAVRAALAPLGDDALLLAQFAAVAGHELDRRELDALPIESPSDAGARAMDSGLLVGAAGRIGYRHALLRDAVYRDLAELCRVGLHEALGTALSAREPRFAAEAARHLRLAGREDLAVAQLVRAAAHARGVAALAEAAAALTEAIELAPADPSVLVELAEVEAWRGRAEESDAAFDRALELLSGERGEELARAWVRRAAWYRGALCHPRHVLEAARQAVELLDTADEAAPGVRVEALAAWAWAEAVAGDPEAADELLARVHAVLGPRAPGDLMAHWVGHVRAFALVRRGRFRDSYAPQIAAAEAALRAGRPDLAHGGWENAACAAASAGDFDRALEFVDRDLTALRGTGLASLEVNLLADRAHILVRLDRADEARAAVDAQRALAERLDIPALLAASEHDSGLVALALGEYDRAERELAAALAHDAPVSRPSARLARAEALVRLGRHDEADAELRATALEPVRPGDLPDALVPRLTRLQGLIAAGRGDHELARRRLTEAVDGWRRLLDRAASGDRYVATLVDFGRPPVVGLIEPARELDRVLSELDAFQAAPT